MKFKLIIDTERDEEVVVYAHNENELTDEIKCLVENNTSTIIGYADGSSVPLVAADVHCFTICNGRVYALTEGEKLQVKERIYTLEKMLGHEFVKINQSCIANTRKIARFTASIGGSLRVIFKNGHIDYVSRRQLRTVKERMGL